MIIDTHCHIDMLENPEDYLSRQEKLGKITIGMTNLPSHFKMGYEHFRNLRYSRLALGYHPLMVADHPSELMLFKKYLSYTSYVGEIGLDFSRDGVGSREQQMTMLRGILACLSGERKIISVHSRRAEKEVYEMLREYDVKNVIFHWYNGPLKLMKEIEVAGYYFSVNEAMTYSQHGMDVIQQISKDRILTETDAPFNEKCDIKVAVTKIGLSEEHVKGNFDRLLDAIR